MRLQRKSEELLRKRVFRALIGYESGDTTPAEVSIRAKGISVKSFIEITPKTLIKVSILLIELNIYIQN